MRPVWVGRAGTGPRSPVSTADPGCRFGRCAVKAVKLTPGDLHRVRYGLRAPRGSLTAVQKSAEGILGGGNEPGDAGWSHPTEGPNGPQTGINGEAPRTPDS